VDCPPIRLGDGTFFQQRSAWSDLLRDILGARHLIYVAGGCWSWLERPCPGFLGSRFGRAWRGSWCGLRVLRCGRAPARLVGVGEGSPGEGGRQADVGRRLPRTRTAAGAKGAAASGSLGLKRIGAVQPRAQAVARSECAATGFQCCIPNSSQRDFLLPSCARSCSPRVCALPQRICLKWFQEVVFHFPHEDLIHGCHIGTKCPILHSR
jgi:hypothetical protein